MKTKILNSLTAIGIAMTLFACQGKQGATGPAGADGAANIQSSIVTVTPNQWTNTSTNIYETTFTMNGFTNPSGSAFEAFLEVSGYYYGLPSNNLINNGDNMEFSYSTNNVNFIYDYTSAPTTNLTFKFVVIPPAAIKQHPNTNWSNYSEVNAILSSQQSNK